LVCGYALTHILEGRYGADKYDLVILDRGLFDALAWFELLQGRDDVTGEECSVIQNFLMIEHWRQFVDMVFLFKTDPDTSLERENRGKLIGEPGLTMNPQFLVDLNGAYQTISDKYSSQFRNLQIVDTGQGQNTTLQSTAFQVAEKIIHLMEQRTG
jgi:thymidylate kinase